MEDSLTPPRLCCSENGLSKVFNAKTCHWWTTCKSKTLRLRFTSHTRQADINPRVSRKPLAQLLRDSSTPWWWRVGTTVRNRWPSITSSPLLRLFISSQVRTHFRSSLTPSLMVVLAKTPRESDPVVSSEDKQSMFRLWEESTRQCTSCAKGLAIHLSDLWRLLLNALPMRLSKLPRVVPAILPPSRRRTKLRESQRATDDTLFR